MAVMASPTVHSDTPAGYPAATAVMTSATPMDAFMAAVMANPTMHYTPTGG